METLDPEQAPFTRRFLTILGLALGLFTLLQVINPNIMLIDGGSTLDSIYETQPGWARGIGGVSSTAGITAFSPAAQPTSPTVLLAQMVLVLFGSLFLALWLWREREASHRYELIFAAVLMGLAAFGSFLGYFVYEEREMPRRMIDFFLPVLIHPGNALLLGAALLLTAALADRGRTVRALRKA
jgi:hypothetical protein